jgi:hypothetical protein
MTPLPSSKDSKAALLQEFICPMNEGLSTPLAQREKRTGVGACKRQLDAEATFIANPIRHAGPTN